jgi:hypothetical protein
VLGHFLAAVPGQGAAQLAGQAGDGGGDRVPDRFGAVPGQGRAVLDPRLGAEFVLLLDGDPGQIETLALDLLVSLRLLGLEPGEFVPGRLPFLASSDPVLGHLISFRLDTIRPRARRSIVGSDTTGITQ